MRTFFTLFLVLGYSLFSITVNAQCPEPVHPDYDALMALYNSTDGQNWTTNLGWAEGAAGTNCNPCFWVNTICDDNDRVMFVALYDYNLNGNLPNELGDLSYLNELHISGNSLLSGEIPSELGNLSNLTVLHLANNNLSGEIPPELGNLSNLTNLGLLNNNLSGEIPPELGALSNLEDLNLFNNNLIGEIPPELGNLLNLTSLRLYGNNLSGCYDFNLYNLCLIDILDVSNNPLLPWEGDFDQFCATSGSIGDQITAPCNDGDDTNSFTDTIDDYCTCVASLPLGCDYNTHPDYNALVSFFNNTNGQNWDNNAGWLDGAFGNNCDPCDGSWYGITCNDEYRVEGISLWNNGIVGSIPSEFWELTSLVSIDFQFNQLGGEISDEISQLINLEILYLIGNELTGEIPTSIGQLSNLTSLRLSSNQLTGSIPSVIGLLPNLTDIVLSNNQLSGTIPAELGQLNLVSFNLQNNQLSGCLDASLLNHCGTYSGLNNNPQLPWEGDYNQFCTTSGSIAEQIGAPCDDGDDSNGTNDVINADCSCGSNSQISGCTDSSACNFDANATIDNGSCTYNENIECAYFGDGESYNGYTSDVLETNYCTSDINFPSEELNLRRVCPEIIEVGVLSQTDCEAVQINPGTVETDLMSLSIPQGTVYPYATIDDDWYVQLYFIKQRGFDCDEPVSIGTITDGQNDPASDLFGGDHNGFDFQILNGSGVPLVNYSVLDNFCPQDAGAATAETCSEAYNVDYYTFEELDNMATAGGTSLPYDATLGDILPGDNPINNQLGLINELCENGLTLGSNSYFILQFDAHDIYALAGGKDVFINEFFGNNCNQISELTFQLQSSQLGSDVQTMFVMADMTIYNYKEDVAQYSALYCPESGNPDFGFSINLQDVLCDDNSTIPTTLPSWLDESAVFDVTPVNYNLPVVDLNGNPAVATVNGEPMTNLSSLVDIPTVGGSIPTCFDVSLDLNQLVPPSCDLANYIFEICHEIQTCADECDADGIIEECKTLQISNPDENGVCNCGSPADVITGCTEPTACNFDPLANCDDGTCNFGNQNCIDPCNPILGCTISTATNYNPDACENDGSCEFVSNEQTQTYQFCYTHNDFSTTQNFTTYSDPISGQDINYETLIGIDRNNGFYSEGYIMSFQMPDPDCGGVMTNFNVNIDTDQFIDNTGTQPYCEFEGLFANVYLNCPNLIGPCTPVEELYSPCGSFNGSSVNEIDVSNYDLTDCLDIPFGGYSTYFGLDLIPQTSSPYTCQDVISGTVPLIDWTFEVCIIIEYEFPDGPDAGPDQNICEGESVTIGADPVLPIGSDYNWVETGDVGFIFSSVNGQIDVAPTTTTTYTVETNIDGCTYSDQVTVFVDAAPQCNTDCTLGDIEILINCQCVTQTVSINGCTNPTANNYNAAANCDDGSCEFTSNNCIVINEILINASGDCDGNSSIPGCLDGTSEFLELYNNCENDIDIGCYVYCTKDFCITIPAGTILNANSYLVFGSPNSSNIDVNASNFIDIFSCNCEYIDPSVANPFDALGIFTNSEDQLILFDDSGTAISGLIWNGGVQFPSGGANMPYDFNIPSTAGCAAITVTAPAIDDPFYMDIGFDPSGPANDCSYGPVCDGDVFNFIEMCNSDPSTPAMSPGEANNPNYPSLINLNTTSCLFPNESIDLFIDLGGAQIEGTVNWDISPFPVSFTITGNQTISIVFDSESIVDISVGFETIDNCNYTFNSQFEVVDEPICNTDCTQGDIEILINCQCVVQIPSVVGCDNPIACNFDPAVNCPDNSLCSYEGCIDPTACNYESSAGCDDGSCIYEAICDDGDCTNGLETWDLGTCACVSNSLNEVVGCTDANYCEYDATATCDDGSCETSNINPGTCNTDCINGPLQTWNSETCECENGAAPILGCTDSLANNYNPAADCDDGTCTYNQPNPFTCDNFAISTNVVLSSAATCQIYDGSILLSAATGGNAPYQYSINGIDFQQSTYFNNLEAGDYNIYVMDADSCGNIIEGVNVAGGQELIVFAPDLNVNCLGSASFSLGFVGDAFPPYDIYFNGIMQSNTSYSYSNLNAGTYQIVAVDATGCSDTIQLETPLNFSFDSYNINTVTPACGENNGSITFEPSNGTPPFTYELNNNGIPTSNNTFSNLSAGSYSITATDANGCSITDGVVFENSSLVTAAVTTFPVSCAGQSDGGLAVVVNEGTPPYNYEITGSANQSNLNGLFSNLPPGAYNVLVTDFFGCVYEQNGIILQSINPLILEEENAIPAGCNAQANGSFSVNATGGTEPYNYYCAALSETNNDGSFNNVPAGNYFVEVTDVNGCAYGAIFTIVEVDVDLEISQTIEPFTCQEDNGGTVLFDVVGGVAPYLYVLGQEIQNNNPYFQAVAAGDYNVLIEDINGCETSFEIEVEENIFQAYATGSEVNCNVYNQGTITFAAQGGYPPYQISIDGGQSFQPYVAELQNINTGIYAVQIKDSDDCVLDFGVEIAEITTPEIVDIIPNFNCTQFDYVEIQVVMPNDDEYTYSADGVSFQEENILYLPWSTMEVLIYVQDENNCITATPFEPILPIDIEYNVVATAVPNTAEITVDIINSLAGLESIEITGPQNFSTSDYPFITNIEGTYTITVSFANDCVFTNMVEVDFNVLSIDETKNLNLFVYPNPAQNWISIDIDEKMAFQNLKIFNATGKLLKVFNEYQNNFDIGVLPKGTYLIVVESTNNEVYSQKIIKY